jgi:hypothetical protein
MINLLLPTWYPWWRLHQRRFSLKARIMGRYVWHLRHG